MFHLFQFSIIFLSFSSSSSYFIFLLFSTEEPGSSGSIVSDYGLDDRASIPGGGKGFFV
jgi:hypothetical protein